MQHEGCFGDPAPYEGSLLEATDIPRSVSLKQNRFSEAPAPRTGPKQSVSEVSSPGSGKQYKAASPLVQKQGLVGIRLCSQQSDRIHAATQESC